MVRSQTPRAAVRALAALTTLMALVVLLAAQAGPASSGDGASSASNFLTFKFPAPQPGCTGSGLNTQPSFAFDRNDCGFVTFALAGNTTTVGITVRLYHPETDAPFATLPVTFRAPPQDGRYQFNIRPDATWPAGIINYEIFVPGETDPAGGAFFRHNSLAADVAVTLKPSGANYPPGEDLPVTGLIYQLNSVPDTENPVPATYSLQLVTPTGDVRGPYGPFTANQGGAGQFSQTIPGAATLGLTSTVDVAVQVIDAVYNDMSSPLVSTGQWRSKLAGIANVKIKVPSDTLLLENSFVSAVGWVKPGGTYPFRIFVKNHRPIAATNATVTVTAADGMVFTSELAPSAGNATLSGGSIVWTIPNVPAAPPNGSTVLTLVGIGEADTIVEDSEVVWKDLSTTATLTYVGGPAGLTSKSHGPKVIPADETYDTARFGDRPFPVVPVDYFDREHSANHTGDALSSKINSPDVAGSTFNLYQEMSFGQLFPNGTVPSAGFASADWNVQWNSERYQQSDFQFTTPMPGGACTGTSFAAARGTPVYQERIRDGWYQLPGDTGYYGSDRSTTAGALVVGSSEIDSACGPTSKAVYDAAHIADPEIDYSDYDTDKDGVVDFFMMVFVGVGGHGASIQEVPPYDNIWPHSFTLEAQYKDQATGLRGYISDDQLKDLRGRPLYYTSNQRTTMTTDPTDFPVPVRVGPYNVNPENSIDQASVISHEYGHSLGLPDFYSGPGTDSRATYGDWSLMATDKSQHMDIFSKQEMGWIVPQELPEGSTTVTGWQDSKADTHEIHWRRPDGTPYTLSGENVHNGQAYEANLPRKKLIDPAKIAAGASPDHVWWSGAGNDFGCAPNGGHSFDIFLPELETAAPGSTVTLRFKSYWDIEWDFDYGFVLVTTDGGETYQSVASANGYSTPQAFNPNAIGCQTTWGNGLTGTSGSYAAGTQVNDRLAINNLYPDGGFLQDQYDISFAAGSPTAVRFSYSTDGGFVRPGWFIDDVQVLVNGAVVYETNFENGPNEPHVFNGGCNEDNISTGPCTTGWRYVDGSQPSAADHAYYLEMRDRSGFDVDGRGENDRDPLGFLPGLYLMYTDEAHGYGNYSTPDPPAQTPLDSQPQPGNRAPGLNDAAWTEVGGDTSFTDSGAGHTDNYTDPASGDGLWHFRHNCLTFDVISMLGRGLGPLNPPPYDLTGAVQFTMGPGCVYTSDDETLFGPTAVIQTRPENATIREGEDITFDGSGSTDDLTPPNELTYEWDFENDGIYDQTGQVVTHRYTVAGTYTARLRVTDGHDLTDIDSVVVTVNPFCETATFSDDFEQSAGAGWEVQTEANLFPTSQPWQLQTDLGAKSPSHSWFSDATTLDLKDDRLLAPPQDLGPSSRLTFWHRFNFEAGFDGGVLEVFHPDVGWRDVLDAGGSFVEGGYNDEISGAFGSPIAGRRAWSGGPMNAVVAPMTKVVVNVGALAGENVRFRFRLAADPLAAGATPGQGWWIDDFEVSGIPQACNRPPLALDDTASTTENTPVTIDVVENDSDPENDALTVTAVTQPANGSVVNNGDGTVTYTPDTNFVSPPDDEFTYTVSDGENSVSARVSVTVNEDPNEAPVAEDDSATTEEDTAVTINVLANDEDADGDTLTVDVSTQPQHGSASVNADETVTYTPTTGFVGTDSFVYTASDGNGGSDEATVEITVNPRPNQAPNAVDDTATTQRDTAVTINVTGNDSDPDGHALTVTNVGSPAHGTAVNNGNGAITYTPDNDFVGDDSFTYTIDDGHNGTDTANVMVAVTDAGNRAPTARPDSATTRKNKSKRIAVLENDTDPDGDALRVTRASDPANGSVTINRGRTVTCTPDPGFTGTDTFTYEISDGKGGTSSAEVTITVRPSGDDDDDDDDDDGGGGDDDDGGGGGDDDDD